MYMRIGDCPPDYVPVVDVEDKCSSDDVTRAAASALLFFSPVLQWVLSQRGQSWNAPLVLDIRVHDCANIQ